MADSARAWTTTKWAFAEDFHDWEEIQRIWRETPDHAALEREFDKCWAVYEPWRESYVDHEYNALEALKTHPERAAIERCDDMRLAYVHWLDRVYHAWSGTFSGTDVCEPSFDDIVEARRGKVRCASPDSKLARSLPVLYSCGNVPDWRTEEQKAEDRKRDAEFAAIEGDDLSRSRELRRERCREKRARAAAEKEDKRELPL